MRFRQNTVNVLMLSILLLFTPVSSTKTAEPIEMPFGETQGRF